MYSVGPVIGKQNIRNAMRFLIHRCFPGEGQALPRTPSLERCARLTTLRIPRWGKPGKTSRAFCHHGYRIKKLVLAQQPTDHGHARASTPDLRRFDTTHLGTTTALPSAFSGSSARLLQMSTSSRSIASLLDSLASPYAFKIVLISFIPSGVRRRCKRLAILRE